MRSVHIASHTLGLYGISDAIELLLSDDPSYAITHPRYPGYPCFYLYIHSLPMM